MYCFHYLELQRPKAGVFWEAASGSLHLERRAQKGWPCSLHPSYLSFQHCDTPCNDHLFGHLQQDEYHMLHLVCASRTPPSSPKPPRSLGNKPQETSAGPAVSPLLALLLISSVAPLLSSPTSLLKHTHVHLPEVCGLKASMNRTQNFNFFFFLQPLQNSNSPPTGQHSQSSSAGSSDGLRNRSGPFVDHNMYLQYMQK